MSPTPAENYEVQPLHDISTKLSIRLTSTSSAMWANVVDEGKTVPLKVVSIDTGAGQVKMPGGMVSTSLFWHLRGVELWAAFREEFRLRLMFAGYRFLCCLPWYSWKFLCLSCRPFRYPATVHVLQSTNHLLGHRLYNV